MTTKYNTISFETAQRLHDVGVKLKTAFFYFHEGEDLLTKIDTELDDKYLSVMDGKIYKIQKGYMGLVFAPTFMELWDALPKDITIDGNICYLYINYEDGYIEYYNSILRKEYIAVKIKDGLVEAAAELLLHLKEKGIWHIK